MRGTIHHIDASRGMVAVMTENETTRCLRYLAAMKYLSAM